MLNLRRGTMLALATASVVLAACSDDDDNNGPDQVGTAFTSEEKTALGNALVSAGAIPSGSVESQLYGLLLGGVTRYGTITVPAAARQAGGLRVANLASTYDATGLQYAFDITINNDPAFAVKGVSVGLVGWSGLDVDAQTVDEWFTLGTFDDTATEIPTGDISGTVPDEVDVEYWVTPDQLFFGISGNASLTNGTFGSSATDCTVTIPTVGTLNCSYTYGSMSGSYDFVAEPLAGGENVTFPVTDYDLPAVRVTLSGNLTIPLAQVPAVRRNLMKLVHAQR